MYVVYLSCDFVTKMIIKIFWKSSLISGLWFGIVQFLNRNIQACFFSLIFQFYFFITKPSPILYRVPQKFMHNKLSTAAVRHCSALSEILHKLQIR